MPTCASCGTQAEGQFCPSCGAPISGAAGGMGQPPEQPAAAPGMSPPAGPGQQPPPAYGQQPPPAYGQQPPAYGQPPPGQYPPGQYPPGAYPPPYGYAGEASAAYWLGILSIIFAFLAAFLGLILAIIAIYLGKQGQKEGLLKADKAVTFGYIGLILSIIFMLITVVLLGAIFAFA